MKSTGLFGFAAAMLVATLGMGTAHASLVTKDLYTDGDGLLTYDTVSGLSWLNVPRTVGASYNSIISGFGGYVTNLGFRYATDSEFEALLVHAGIKEGTSTSWDTADINSTRNLLSLVGVTATDGHTYVSYGYLASPTTGVDGVGVLAVNDIGEYDALVTPLGSNWYTPSVTGSFLVRSSTPAAHASLVTKDLYTDGDGLLTYDTVSGLSWLNVPRTVGASYNSIISGFGGYVTNLGFRYATDSEFEALLVHAGIKEGTSTSWDTADINSTRNLLSLVGVTATDGHTYVSYGYLASPTTGVDGVGVLAVNDIGEYDALVTPLGSNWYTPSVTGSFLVRSSTPAPVPALPVHFLAVLALSIGFFCRKSVRGRASQFRV